MQGLDRCGQIKPPDELPPGRELEETEIAEPL